VYFGFGKDPTSLQQEYIKDIQINRDSPSESVSTEINLSVGKIPSVPFSLPEGYVIRLFAVGINSARDLQFSPGGTLLVSDPNAGSVYALPDENNDGVADMIKTVISGENRPHGIAFYQNKLFVAEVDRVVRYSWDENSLTAVKDKVLFSLPKNLNHNNRTIVFDKLGKMFVSVGSTCNVCNEASPLSGSIIVSDVEGSNPTVFAKGLRNAPFMQINPETGDLWATGMGRDNLGDSLPPDEIDIIKQGKDYGWPNCYGNKIPDLDFNPNADCINTEPPIYEIPAHSAPLGLAFIKSTQFRDDQQNDLLVAYHGSWNSSVPVGYKVVRLIVKQNSIIGSEDFITGFISDGAISGFQAKARPVDLVFDDSGNLYLSDDKAGNVYIVQKAN
jgi:glucose/arabinose dehydrogenase